MLRRSRHKLLDPLRARPAFTLVELLVVIAIIGVLVGLLLPAVQAAREAARRTQCKNNLTQLAKALHDYHGQKGAFPSGSRIYEDRSGETVGWRVMLLPYLEKNALYEEIAPLPNGDANNWEPNFRFVDILICPSGEPPIDEAETDKEAHYDGVAGANTSDERMDLEEIACGDVETNGIFYPNSAIPISRITDGTSNTLAIGERSMTIGTMMRGYFRPWMNGAIWKGIPPSTICAGATKNIHFPINASPYTFGFLKVDTAVDAAFRKMLFNELQFGSEHPGGTHFAFADGSVHFLEESIDFNIYQALATRAGEEPLRFEGE